MREYLALLIAANLLTSFGFCHAAQKSGWSATESLLYWYAKEHGLGYTNRPANVLTTDDFTENSAISPAFDWDLGLRLGTSYTQPNSKWTFQAYWNYLTSNAHGDKNVNSGSPDFLGSYPIWSMGPDTLVGDYVSSSSLKWHLITNIIDLFAQYNYSCLENRLDIMSFCGARGAFLSQKIKAKYAGGTFFNGVDSNVLRSHYNAGGPCGGILLDYYINYGLSIFGRGAIAPLFGNICIKQKETYLGATRFHRASGHYHFVLSTDYAVGMKWKTVAIQDRLCVALYVAWEGQEFFYANSFYRGPHHFFSKNRDLLLQGLTFTIALDF